MNKIVEIDKDSGFCFGVVRAIRMAEEILEKEGKLFCLGKMVHNRKEVERLEKRGMVVIDHSQFEQLRDVKVLIRAHGEPPSTYKTAKKNNLTLIDGSCPVVLKLQERVRKSFRDALPENGQVVIFGKKGHAEVTGLVGQTGGNALVVENAEDIEQIDFTRPVYLYSQTTKGLSGYYQVAEAINNRLAKNGLTLHCTDSICRQVSTRSPKLKAFASRHQLILFVSGRDSSNGKMLFEDCRAVNPNCFFIEGQEELEDIWFDKISSVGICGATSTPRWLMEVVAERIGEILNRN